MCYIEVKSYMNYIKSMYYKKNPLNTHINMTKAFHIYRAKHQRYFWMDLSWQSEKEVPSSQRKKVAMSGIRRQQAVLFNILFLGLLLAFLPQSSARQRGSSPVVRHVS